MQEQVALIPEVVSQFGENCASLWEDRERSARSRVYPSTFQDLCALDSRIDAQLDGLRVSGAEGWRLAAESLELQGSGEIFTASVLAFEGSNGVPPRDRIDVLLDSEAKPGVAARPMSMALDWMSREQSRAAVRLLSASGGPLSRAVILMARAARGIDCADNIVAAFEEGEATVVQAACWAAVRLGARSVIHALTARLQSEDSGTRSIAARAALLLGGNEASGVLEGIARNVSLPEAEEAAAALFRSCTPTRALSLHRNLFGGLPSRASVCAAASAGIPDLIPFLMECLNHKPLSRLSGNAISEITGLDLSASGLTAEKPEDTRRPSEDPEDEDTALDLDQGLPCPDPPAVQSWWKVHCTDFTPMTRYLGGRIVGPDMLKQCVRTGPQRRRAVAAEMLALSGRPLFDVCAPSFRQTEKLTGEDLWR